MPEGLTVEEGRALVARARRFQIGEKIGLAVSALGIVVFVASIVELRQIDAAMMSGGLYRVPYTAYLGMLLFWGGFGGLWWARSRVLRIHRTLDLEQKRRDAERVATQIAAAHDADKGQNADETMTPAPSGPANQED